MVRCLLYHVRTQRCVAAACEYNEAALGAGERHVEQVEIVYAVLQMFHYVVALVYSAHHLLRTEVYRHKR